MAKVYVQEFSILHKALHIFAEIGILGKKIYQCLPWSSDKLLDKISHFLIIYYF
jgi:hypothetical protein